MLKHYKQLKKKRDQIIQLQELELTSAQKLDKPNLASQVGDLSESVSPEKPKGESL